VAAVDAGDEDRFHEVFEQMLELVPPRRHAARRGRARGVRRDLPPPDLSFIEAAAEFSSESLIPD
jgi:hypothetical protein